MVQRIGSLLILTGGAFLFRAHTPDGPGAHNALPNARAVIESYAASGEAVLCFEAEGEGALVRFEIRDPSGALAVALETPRAVHGRVRAKSAQVRPGPGGLFLELSEPSLPELLADYPAGRYEFRAWTAQGRPMSAATELSHELLRAPLVLPPFSGASGAASASRAAPTIRWTSDRAARGYRVRLEQEEEEDELYVELPAGSNSFRIPDGYLRPGRSTHVEVGAVTQAGNCTYGEGTFRTPD